MVLAVDGCILLATDELWWGGAINRVTAALLASLKTYYSLDPRSNHLYVAWAPELDL